MEITKNIHAIKIPFQIPVGPGKNLDRFVYTYILSGGQTVLVDSAVANSETIIFDYLKTLGKKPADIARLILTHAHPDHIGSARAVKAQTGCLVAAHPAARSWVEDVEQQFRERPVPGFHSLVGGSVKIDQLLEDNSRLDLGGLSIDVIHTPGHSGCSLSLYCREEGVLFTGDSIPQGNDLPIYEDAAQAVASIRTLQRLDGVQHLLASWTDPQSDADPYRIMENSLAYFQRIHVVIRDLRDQEALKDMALCRKVVEKLGLPEVAVNPIVARAFASHLPLLNQEKL